MEYEWFLTIVGTARRRLIIFFPIYDHPWPIWHDFCMKIFCLTVNRWTWCSFCGRKRADWIPIDQIIVHPNYNPEERPRYDYDVALVKLKDPINFNISVRPVCLPTMDFLPGTNCYVTGWGNTTEGGNISQVNILILCVQSFHLRSRVAYKRIGVRLYHSLTAENLKIPKRQFLYSHAIDTVHINAHPYVHYYSNFDCYFV